MNENAVSFCTNMNSSKNAQNHFNKNRHDAVAQKNTKRNIMACVLDAIPCTRR